MSERAADDDSMPAHESEIPMEASEQPRQADESGEIEVLRREAEENWNKYVRALAELDNARKRAARDVEGARKYGVERLAHALLPVRDSLEAGLGVQTADLSSLLEGMRATLRLLDEALSQAGVEEIDPHGEPFDPNLHEAMSVRAAQDVEANTVVEVVQKGYRVHDRLLRPARVIVAQAADPAG